MRKAALAGLVAIIAAFSVPTTVVAQVEPANERLPYCTDAQLNAPGAATAAEAKADAEAAKDAPVMCQVAPSDITTIEDPRAKLAAPTSPEATFVPGCPGCYHWVGFQTTEFQGQGYDFEGQMGTVQVKNIDNMPHDGDLKQFVVSRIFTAVTFPENTWLEVGWAETDWQGTNAQQFSYSYDGQQGLWHFYGSALSGGTFYTYRLRSVGSSSMEAHRLNNNTGAWVLLDTSNTVDCTPDRCNAAALTEIFTNPGTALHPDWSGNIAWNSLKIDKAATSFPNWTEAQAPTTKLQDAEGYNVCNPTEWTAFNAKRFAC